MNFKTTYILFGLLGAVLVLFGLSQFLKKKPKEDVSYVLPSLHDKKIAPKDVTIVEIETTAPKYKAEKIVLVRRGEGWHVQQPDVRADRHLINQVIQNLFDVRREEKSTELTNNLADYGLQPPSAVVTLKVAGDRQWTLNVGDESGGSEDAVVYVTSSDRPKEVMAVLRSQLSGLFRKETAMTQQKEGDKVVDKETETYRIKTLNDYRSRDLLTEGVINVPDAALQIDLQASGHPAVVLQKTEGRWRFQEPKLGDADYDGTPGPIHETQPPTGVRDLIKDLAEIRVSTTRTGKLAHDEPPDNQGSPDFVADDVQDMASYGLEAGKPATLRVQLKRKAVVVEGDAAPEPVTEALLVGNKVDGKYFARLESERTVVKVAAEQIDPILAAARQPDSLRSHDLVTVERAKIDAMNIKNANGQVELRRPSPNEWKVFIDHSKEEREANGDRVQQVLNALTASRQVLDFPGLNQEAELGFDKPDAVTVELWLDGLQTESTKDANKPSSSSLKLKDEQHPAVALTLVKRQKEGKSICVSRRVVGSEKVLLEVPAVLYDLLNQGPLSLVKAHLLTFAEGADVTKVALERDGESFVMEKDPKEQSVWRLKKPDDLAGRRADALRVNTMIDALRRLRTSQLVKESPGAADLEAYHLKSPIIKATLTVLEDKKRTDHVYLFGSDTPGGTYTEQSGQNLVFLVDPQSISALREPLRIDPARVKEIKFSGWKNVYKIFSMTLDLERKADRNWVVKAGPNDFKLDQEKVSGMLKDLTEAARPFVDRFVEGGVKPEYRLDQENRLLEIEITVDGERNPYVLTIGDLDPAKTGYYAQSSTLPQAVFVLSRERCEKLLAGVEYFSQKTK